MTFKPEYEARFLDIERGRLIRSLQAVTILRHEPVVLMHRCLFDSPERTLFSNGAWLRVRDEGAVISTTLKKKVDDKIGGIKELEVQVNDFEIMCDIFREIGLDEIARQETRREEWWTEDCRLTLDEWPWIPPFVEIEGPDKDKVHATAEALDFDWAEASFDSVDGIYDFYYPGTRAAISSCSLTFSERPSIFPAEMNND